MMSTVGLASATDDQEDIMSHWRHNKMTTSQLSIRSGFRNVLLRNCVKQFLCSSWKLTLFAVLLFSYTSAQSTDAPPTWDVKPQNRTVTLMSNTSLSCHVNNSGSRSLVWSKIGSDGSLILFINTMRFKAPQTYFVTSDAVSGLTLYLTSIQTDDDAVYKCDVQESSLSASAQVTVLVNPGPPVIALNVTDDELKENTVVQFTCSSSGGNPAPVIRWFRDGILLPNVTAVPPATKFGTTSSVLVWRLSRSDFLTNFSCSAETKEISNSLVANWTSLLVKYAPVISLGRYNPLSVVENSSLSLNCNVTAYPEVDPSNIQWLKDGLVVGNGGSFFVAAITAVEAGTYTCSARNYEVTTANITVDVLYPPKAPAFNVTIATENFPINLTMAFDANPPVDLSSSSSMKWYKGSTLFYTGAFFSIPLVSRSNAGNYTVEATNVLAPSGGTPSTGTGRGSFQLRVLYKPGQATVSVQGTAAAAAVVGQKVSLTCAVDDPGDPVADRIWSRVGGNETFPKGAVLEISNAQLSNIGNYTCTPTNELGSGPSSTTFLDVYDPAAWIQLTLPSKLDVLLNASVAGVVCQARGRPAPAILWYKDGQAIDATSELYDIVQTSQPFDDYRQNVTSVLNWKGAARSPTRTSLTPDDAGIYSCQASVASAGSPINQTMELVVRYPPIAANSSAQVGADLNTPAILIYNSRGYPPPSFTWRDGRGVVIATGDRYQIQSSAKGSTLTIKEMRADDAGNYSCQADNDLGSAIMTFALSLNTVPSAPTQLKMLSKTWESAELTWAPGHDGGCPQDFVINIRGRSSVAAGSASTFNLTGLFPNTTYNINVQPRNRIGSGQPSNTITLTTNELALAPPTNVRYNPASKTLTCYISDVKTTSCLLVRVRLNSDLWSNTSVCDVQSNAEVKLESLVQDADVKAVEASACLGQRTDVCSQPQNADFVSDIPVRTIIIVCCVCGGVIAILLIVLIVCCCCVRRNKSRADEQHAISAYESSGTQTDLEMKSDISPSYTNGIDNPAVHQVESPGVIYGKKGAFLILDSAYPLDRSDSHGSHGSDSGVSVSEVPRTKRIIHEVVV